MLGHEENSCLFVNRFWPTCLYDLYNACIAGMTDMSPPGLLPLPLRGSRLACIAGKQELRSEWVGTSVHQPLSLDLGLPKTGGSRLTPHLPKSLPINPKWLFLYMKIGPDEVGRK